LTYIENNVELLMGLFIKDASEVLTMKSGIGLVKDASISIEKGKISAVGSISMPRKKCTVINAKGCVVSPGFVDSHTHLVYGGSREEEFSMRVAGMKYEEIAKAGGGIAATVKMTRQASEDELFKSGMERLKAVVRHGTTTIEIKSGYGLSPTEELKMLRAIKKLKARSSIEVIPTYLVHTIPHQMKRRDYVDLVTEEIIPLVARKKLAVFCDVFCDKLAFTRRDTLKILTRAREYNMKCRIHADQFGNIGAVRLAAKLKCTSADHLEYTAKGSIKAMRKAGVVPILLPGVTLFLHMKKKPNIKAFRNVKAHVAIASDYNPGSCMIYSMPKIISLACLLYGMSAEESLMGATKYGAQALGLEKRIGTIEKGKQADLVVLNVDKYKKIPYQFGEDIVVYTIKKGKVVYGKNC
jgi:imidazolonepropionase